MKLRIPKLDIISGILLSLLVGAEFYFERKHLFGSTETILGVAIGLVIGVNIGFKLGAIHIAHVSKRFCDIAESCESKLNSVKQKEKKTERELEISLSREMKLRQTLASNLKERDEEVKLLFDRLRKHNAMT